MTEIRVRAETPMLGLNWREEAVLERTDLVDAAIVEGRLTVVHDDGTAGDALRGPLLDRALEAAGLSTTGKVGEKQERLDAHRAQEAARAVTPDPSLSPLAGPDDGKTLQA